MNNSKSSSNEETSELLSARMLNEFAYCPRLFYLECVQGEFEHSADTVDGRFKHRRVDKKRGMDQKSRKTAMPLKRFVYAPGKRH